MASHIGERPKDRQRSIDLHAKPPSWPGPGRGTSPKIASAIVRYATSYPANNRGAVRDGPDAARASYGTNYERLAAIKARYDPDNVFHSNQNVGPGT